MGLVAIIPEGGQIEPNFNCWGQASNERKPKKTQKRT